MQVFYLGNQLEGFIQGWELAIKSKGGPLSPDDLDPYLEAACSVPRAYL